MCVYMINFKIQCLWLTEYFMRLMKIIYALCKTFSSLPFLLSTKIDANRPLGGHHKTQTQIRA